VAGGSGAAGGSGHAGSFVNGGSGGGASGFGGSAVFGGAGHGNAGHGGAGALVGGNGGASGAVGQGGSAEEGPPAAVARMTLLWGFAEEIPVAVQQPALEQSKGLWLVSSHLIFDWLEESSPTLEWLGEVENVGNEVVCNPYVKVVFHAGAVPGVERFTLTASVKGKHRLTSSSQSPSRCVAPGETAPAWFHAPHDLKNKVEDSRLAVVSWLSVPTTESEPDPHAPSLHDLTVEGNQSDRYGVRGVVQLGSAALSTLTLNVYPRVDGVLAGSMSTSIYGEQLPAGGQKEIATSGFQVPFSSFLTAVDYAESTAP
jgi:hypothetical protein